MKHLYFTIIFIFLTVLCYGQTLPDKIIGKIPYNEDNKTFQIQVGAFAQIKNAELAYLKLKNNALNPVIKTTDLSRVLICGIPANQVYNFLIIIKQAGFNEVIIREDLPNENNNNTQTIIPKFDNSIKEEFNNSEIEQKINGLSDEEFIELLSLMEEFPERDIQFLINTVKTMKNIDNIGK